MLRHLLQPASFKFSEQPLFNKTVFFHILDEKNNEQLEKMRNTVIYSKTDYTTFIVVVHLREREVTVW